ncbi:MAG: hypothetical protein B6I20_08920 [Bacteroidetes bacterium 4572_117]|nr:MAG: hypothetical protein B6I20_08920 [Bacteroidetes bacterium 4572_117]
MAFCQHLGIEYYDGFDLTDSLIISEAPESVYTNHTEALQNRKEFSMLNKAVDAEVLKTRIAIGENLPKIAIGVQGLYLDQFDNQNTYGIAFATLSIPISGWWAASHKIKEHKIKEDIARNNLEQKSELMVLQMEKGYKDLNESYRQIMIAESSVKQAQEHHKVIEDNYKAGVVNTSDLLEAQAILQDSENQLLEVKNNYKMKLLYYKKTIAKSEL